MKYFLFYISFLHFWIFPGQALVPFHKKGWDDIRRFFFPVFLLLFNFLSKATFLSHEDIGLDEPFTIYHAQFGFATIVEQLKNYNNPPLYELILHVWMKAFGNGPLTVRILPLIFACCCPVTLYYFGKRFFSTEVGVISSLLLSCSDVLFYYSHDCRVYSLFLLLSLLSVYFFFELLYVEIQKVRSIFLFILFSSLLIYAHYFGIFILVFQGAHLLLFYRSRLLKFIGYYVVIAILYLPHLFSMLTRMGHSVKNGTWLASPNGVESLYNMLWSFSNFPFITVGALILLIFSLIKAIKEKAFVQPQKNLSFILVSFLFPFFGMFAISYWVPMYISRYLIFALPAYYILMTVCVQYLIKKDSIRTVIFIVLILSFAGTINFKDNKKQRMADMAEAVRLKKTPETLVLIPDHDLMLAFTYYYNRSYFSSVGDDLEYHRMDSLLRTDHIISRSGDDHFNVPDTAKYKAVIYYADGDKDNNPRSPLLIDLNKLYKQDSAVQVNSNHKIIFFSKKS